MQQGIMTKMVHTTWPGSKNKQWVISIKWGCIWTHTFLSFCCTGCGCSPYWNQIH